MTDNSPLTDLALRWEELREEGKDISIEELCKDHPDWIPEVAARIVELEQMDWLDEHEQQSHQQELGVDYRSRQGIPTSAESLNLYPGAEPIPGYRLIRRLAAGAFGVVWLAEDFKANKYYALKFVERGMGPIEKGKPSTLEQQGVSRISSLFHPFILRTRLQDSDGSALVFISELADSPLSIHFERKRQELTPLICSVYALFLLRDAAEALDYLHANGINHNDVKPDNLLLVNGRCKLADFGTVTEVPGSGEAAYSNTTGAFTRYYAPPEAFQGKTSRSSDQYSLALTYCQLVAGRIPFSDSKNIEDRRRGNIVTGFLEEPLREPIRKALSPRPQHRFPSCTHFVSAMRDAILPIVREDPAGIKWLVTEWELAEKADGHAFGGPLPTKWQLAKWLRPEEPTGQKANRSVTSSPSIGSKLEPVGRAGIRNQCVRDIRDAHPAPRGTMSSRVPSKCGRLIRGTCTSNGGRVRRCVRYVRIPNRVLSPSVMGCVSVKQDIDTTMLLAWHSAGPRVRLKYKRKGCIARSSRFSGACLTNI